ncbi:MULTISPECIES: MspA family porin [Rhodococcus]|uniref:MspA family porin n=1 Tax=Rhodococcus sp. D-6 TaxID=1387842 RepID=A0AAU7V5H7_9NOCA|nr:MULTISPECIES: MspA family porin [Rhodococcus]MCT7290717.1 MspA family porin [Rhodococcus sp. PAE-6]OBA35868.1 porin [Rhodococcus sp. 852002-51564_SCH6189132-a]UTM39375.1 MspA family porin [Rhodococcus pyridinivorans]
MKIQTRRGFRATRNATVAAAAVAGLVLGSAGAAGAEVNDQNRIVSNGHEVIVTQEDTFINGVPPIGGSPLSREWFHNGRGIANIVGPEAADFEGSTFQFGYQVAWSAAIDGSIGFNWTSPDASLKSAEKLVPQYKMIPNRSEQDGEYVDANGKVVKKGDLVDYDGNKIEDASKAVPKKDAEGKELYTPTGESSPEVVDTLTVKSILPQLTAGIELTPAPGIEELVVAEGQFDGDYKEVQIANVHGAATGVVGPVSVRPFVRVITENGDNVTTYGQVWTL